LRNPFFSLLQKAYYAVGGRGLGRIKPLRRLYDLAFKALRPRAVRVEGQRMWLDDRDTLELGTHGIYEPVETGLLKRELRPGDTFLDVGANIGYYTLIAARIVGPEGRVFAFEPDPVNFELLRKNVEANGHSNVTLVNKAVSDRGGTLRLFVNEANRGDHRIYDSRDGRRSLSIQAVALDGFFKKLDRKIQFIKMDIQGAEARALEGMKGLIRSNRPLKLVTEFSPGSLKLCGSDPAKYLKSLQKLGFRVREISEKEGSIRSADLKSLTRSLTDDSNRYTNLFCVKK
jgi:FkbM family methyltransferase